MARVHTGCRFCGTGGWFRSYWLDSHTSPPYKPKCNQPKHQCPAEEAADGKQRNCPWSLTFRQAVLQMHELEMAPSAGSFSCKDHKETFLQSYLTFIECHIFLPSVEVRYLDIVKNVFLGKVVTIRQTKMLSMLSICKWNRILSRLLLPLSLDRKTPLSINHKNWIQNTSQKHKERWSLLEIFRNCLNAGSALRWPWAGRLDPQWICDLYISYVWWRSLSRM